MLQVLLASGALLGLGVRQIPCHIIKDVDINPHTPGLGHATASDIAHCCVLCRSPTWWKAGCRFATLSKGQCWFKANNRTVVPSPGHVSVECLSV